MTAAFQCIFLTFVFQNKNVFARSTSGKERSLFTGCHLWTSLHKNVSPLNQNISRSHNRRRFLLHGNKSPDESAHLSSLARAIQNIIAFRRHRHAIDDVRATGKLRRVCAFEQSRQNLCYPHSKHKCI